MKKITKLLVVAVIAMMTIATACSGAKDAALEKVVEQINEQIKDQKMPGIVEMKQIGRASCRERVIVDV